MQPLCYVAAATKCCVNGLLHQRLGVNVNMKTCSGDTARSLALMKGHRKIVSLIDNHVVGSFLPQRMIEQGSSCYSLECPSSSDESYPSSAKRPASRKVKQSKNRGASIQDGPEAFELLMDRVNMASAVAAAKKCNFSVKRPVNSAIIPQGYVAFASSVPDLDAAKNFRYRDVTSLINTGDNKVDSSGGKDSPENDDECNIFSQTGALTIKSSSSSSEGLAAALKICQEIGSDSFTNANGDQSSTNFNPAESSELHKDFVVSEINQLTTFEPQQWINIAPGHRETDISDTYVGTSNLGVDRDSLISLNPSTLTSQAYIEQRQVLQQRPQNLAQLLQELNLSKYLSIFEEQDVDLQVFLTLTDNDLHEIGIKLFGPRKKMNVAIARWHSNARPSGNDLEQAYADKLETEMQEMAIQLHQANNLLDQMKRQLLQEREIRSVTESCLMEDRATSHHIYQLSADSLQRCLATRDLLMNACLFVDEINRRKSCGDILQTTSHGAVGDYCPDSTKHMTLQNAADEKVHELSNQLLISKLQGCHEEMSRTFAAILMNTETVLKKQFKTILSGFPVAPSR